jgi:hypothetical protein
MLYKNLRFEWQGNYGHIFDGERHLGYVFMQESAGSRLYAISPWRSITLPRNRYSTCCEKPLSGAAGLSELMDDLDIAIAGDFIPCDNVAEGFALRGQA